MTVDKGLNPLEVGGIIVASVVAVASLLGALKTLGAFLRGIPHGIAAGARWLVRFIRTVNVIAGLPGRLDSIDTGMSDHLAQAEKQRKEIQDQLDLLLVNQKVVVHEVQHNGGTSIKDDIRDLKRTFDQLLLGLDGAQVTGNFILPKREVQAKEPATTTGEVSLSA